MNDNERKIIVDEINKWRSSKLLPSEYCDFLLNLYSAGGTPNTERNDSNFKAAFSIKKLIWILFFGIIGSLLLFLIVNFKSYPIGIQIMSLFLLSFFSYICLIIYKFKGSNEAILLLIHNVASVILVFSFLYIISILENNFIANEILILLSIVFLIWLLMSLWMKHIIIFAASLTGYSIVYYNFVTSRLGVLSDITSEIYWIPLAIIVVWIAYAINQNKKYHKHSILLLIVSIMYFLIPQLNSIFLGNITDNILYMIIVKIFFVLLAVYLVYKSLKNTNKNIAEL